MPSQTCRVIFGTETAETSVAAQGDKTVNVKLEGLKRAVVQSFPSIVIAERDIV